METAAVKSARSTGSWVFKWLGIMWGAGIVISLTKRGFSIELRGLPQTIYEQYSWLRDMLFEPVVWFFREIPAELKDGVMLYALVGAAASRACVWYFREFHGRDATLYERGFYALFWPITMLSNTLAGMLTVEAIIVGGATAAFFFWNHVQNVFGPS